ncbi:histidine kinase [Streptomyces sp. NPDC051976]|uniref:ATP-binding protein n=1 Tax=Streptomyces sp. NPDC051976 TaxID=3154947 RepID=UPI0034443D02
MITPYVVAETLLGGGFAAASGALIAQVRRRQAVARALAAAKAEAVQTEQVAARHFEESERAALEQMGTLRGQVDANWRWYEHLLEETCHLAQRRLPALVDAEVRGYANVTAPGLRHPMFQGTPVEEAHASVEAVLREGLAVNRIAIARAARAGVRGAADDAQAFLTRLQMKIDEELDRFPAASAYHQGLSDIDHYATMALHQLQRLRILAGSWPGLQRANASFREIVESARGRIGPYERVHYTYVSDVGERQVQGRVVEPITVALAELLANATAYSSDNVEVYVQQVQVGYRIVVEDTGLGMNASQRAEAERLLSHRAVMDVAELADERRLGFAVIGRLTHDYHLRADVGAPSSAGGVKAVLLVPTSLLGEALPPEDMVGVISSRAAQAWELGREPAPESPALSTATGLPKRRPKGPSGVQSALPSQEAATDTTDPAVLDAAFTRMRQALRDGYGTDDTPNLKDTSDDL